MNSIYFRDGNLYCENVEINNMVTGTKVKRTVSLSKEERLDRAQDDTMLKIEIEVPPTPVYVYSSLRIKQNIQSYTDAINLSGISGKIGYAIKANGNLELLKKMKEFGVETIIAVSGYEVMAGLTAGFTPENIIFNGNGKQTWEVKLAIELGVMMNVDSLFDAQRIVQIHKEYKTENLIKLLLRIRPNKPLIEQHLNVHEYVNTAENSKFGFSLSELPEILEILNSDENLNIIGIHCHFGSGISNPKVYEWLGATISEIKDELTKKGISVKILNVGGGIGIDYFEKPKGYYECVGGTYEQMERKTENNFPNISTFISALSKNLPKDAQVIFEPGRSLIGKAGILVSNVLGTKKSNNRNLMVIDGSMNEVIRPCLYGAHHEIVPTKIGSNDKWEIYDVVGPICESSDFLGKGVRMPLVKSGNEENYYVAIMDVGAYCSSMASNYNLKARAAEILVDGNEWKFIRNRETFEDILEQLSN